MSVGPTLKMKKRLNRVVITVIVLAFAFISANLVKISVVDYDYYNSWGNAQQLRSETVSAARGSIYDRNMEVLAQSATVWDVAVDPVNINDKNRDLVVNGLRDILELSDAETEKLREETTRNIQYYAPRKKVEQETREKVQTFLTDNNLANQISLMENTKRYYPNGTMAASVIGFVGTDNQGLYGLEAKYDDLLSGTPGYILSLKNAKSENIPNSLEEKVDPADGSSLVLTLDETIQHFTDKALAWADSEYLPKQGCAAIVMNVKTGEILAMSNRPGFDLNDPFTVYDDDLRAAVDALAGDERTAALQEARGEQWTNKSIAYVYQPGSTFKTITASAALEERTSSLNDGFYCPGFVKVGDRTMNCHKAGGHGSLDFTGALVGSCNPAFVAIGQKLGAGLFSHYMTSFGFGRRTGIDLPGESEGVILSEKGLQSEVSLASSSFGQSNAVTPIQLVTAVAAVVNGGYLLKPYVVKDVLDASGNVIRSTQPEIRRQVISEETSAVMRGLMEQVVIEKGGTNAYVKGYRIGGKSGTSQKQNPGDAEDARIGSYVAVAPVDDPEIAVYVMIDEPQSGDVYGSVVAAPVTAMIMRDALPYLGYSPKYSAEEAAEMEVVVPTLLELGLLEASSALSRQGLGEPKVIGDGTVVVRQVPSSGNLIPRDGTVILYTEDSAETMSTVPDVLGMKPSRARQALGDADINVTITGPTGDDETLLEITYQSLEPGTEAPIGTVMEITSTKMDTD